MKNKQRGFVIPLIIAIVAILAISGGTYIYVNKKPVASPSVDSAASSTVQVESKTTATTSTVTVTKHVETSVRTDTFSPTASGDVTTTLDCGDETCFDKKFITCEPATLQAEAGPGAVEYKIIGKGITGCELTFKYTKYLDPAWVNKEMTCEFNNKIAFQESLQNVFIGVTTGTVVCTGPLYDILHKK